MPTSPQEVRRQHYIPKMLLKRFASRTRKKNSLVWCFSKSKEPFEPNINNVAVSAWFYGKEGDIENFLSNMENRASLAIDAILHHGDDPNNHLDSIIPFLWLMHWRTLSLREAGVVSGSLFMESMGQTMFGQTNNALMERLLLLELETNLDSYLKDFPQTHHSTIKALLSNPETKTKMIAFLRDHAIPVMGQHWAGVCDRMPEQLKDSISQSMNGAVREMINSGKTHPDNFVPSRLRIQRDASNSFILGDSCIFCSDADGKVFGVSRAREKDWSEIYLPISDSCVLIAERGDTNAKHSFSTQEINELSAKMSTECIFASDRKHLPLSNFIGQMSLLMDATEVNELSENTLRDLLNERLEKIRR
ncbi:DUF4238 domain-containing protein [bacterium]|nr:MAG: DUF4238 domain-containing protein [bacterium]